MSFVVGLAGYARAGKDTVGQILVEKHGFKRLAFADSLRELALKVNPIIGLDAYNAVRLATLVHDHGWEFAKGHYHETRIHMQHLGVGCREVFGDDIWLRRVETQILESKWTQGVVVTDVRFVNEAQMIKTLGGKVFRVKRPGTEAVNAHVSEHALDGWDYDGIIRNGGTIRELQREVEAVFALDAGG